MTPRVQKTRDAVIAIAQKLFGFLSNAIVEHRADTVLSQLWAAGLIVVSRSELESWRIGTKAIAENLTRDANARTLAGDSVGARLLKEHGDDLKLANASIQRCLMEWRNYHDRNPEHNETGIRQIPNSRNQRKR